MYYSIRVLVPWQSVSVQSKTPGKLEFRFEVQVNPDTVHYTVNPVLWYYTLQYSLNHRDEKDGERCLLRTKCETGAREAPPDVGLHLVFRRPRVSGCRLCERFALPRYEARMANRGRDLGRDAKGTLCGGDDEAEEDDELLPLDDSSSSSSSTTTNSSTHTSCCSIFSSS